MTRARDIANLLGTNTNGIIDNAKITLDAAEVPNLAASKITSETFVDARLPNLATSKITSGTFADARIPNLNASKINAGTLADARIPNLNASKINAGTIATARLGSGTASSSTFLRGDNTFAAAGGANTPTFRAYLNSNISMNNSADTTAIFNAETFDPQSVYNTSNGRFTIPSNQAGKYFVGTCIRCNISSTNTSMNVLKVMIFQYNSSNSLLQELTAIHNPTYTNEPTFGVEGLFNCSVGDYFLVKNYLNGSGYQMVAGSNATWFNAFKIIE